MVHVQRGLVVAGETAAASTRSVYTIQQCTVLPSAPSLLNWYCECFQRCQVLLLLLLLVVVVVVVVVYAENSSSITTTTIVYHDTG